VIDTLFFWLRAIPILFLILVPLVLIHEFGHFLMARVSGIRVLEFGLGFPPRAKVLGRDHETEYTLNYLPIGGFVRLEGEESDSDDPRAFTNASLPKQLLVLAAGVFMNLVMAVFLLFIVAWVFNPVLRPTIATPAAAPERDARLPGSVYVPTPSYDFTVVTSGSPAEVAGLQPGDTLISLNGEVPSLLDFSTDPIGGWKRLLNSHAGEAVTLVVADAKGVQRTVNLTLHVPTATQGWALGASFGNLTIVNTPGDPVKAAGLAVNGTAKAMGLILNALGDIGNSLVSHPTQAPSGVQGPVGIASDIGHLVTQPNALMLLLLMAGVISANLALVNFLPFPPLDGGKAVIMIVKRLFGAKGVSAVEATAYVAGFAFLLGFIAWISYFDIVRGGAP
jgi:regulator of sigma E protease